MGNAYAHLPSDQICWTNRDAYYWEDYSRLKGIGNSVESALEDLKQKAALEGVPQPVFDPTVGRYYCGEVAGTTCHLCCFWDNQRMYRNTVFFERRADTYIAYVLYHPFL